MERRRKDVFFFVELNKVENRFEKGLVRDLGLNLLSVLLQHKNSNKKPENVGGGPQCSLRVKSGLGQQLRKGKCAPG